MTIHPVCRRLLAASCLAVATAAAPAVFALGSPVPTTLLGDTDCPPGTTENPISGSCFASGNDQGPAPVQAPTNQLGEIDGIPCTGHNTGQCIGLSENQPPQIQPHSSVSSSR